MPTRAEIHAAIITVTGDPDTGVIRDITPGIVEAIDELCNPAPKGRGKGAPGSDTRVTEADETR